MADEEKLYNLKMFAKIQKHLAWMATNESRVLGDSVHEMMQFVADHVLDCVAEIEKDEDGLEPA
jgi:hypothetical protein